MSKPMSKQEIKGLKLSQEERELINNTLMLIFQRSDKQGICDLLYQYYFLNDNYKIAMNNYFKQDKIISGNDALYFKMNKYKLGDDASAKKHWNSIFNNGIDNSKYIDFKFNTIIAIKDILIHSTVESLYEYLDKTKKVKTNAGFIKTNKIYHINAMIYYFINSNLEVNIFYYNNKNILKDLLKIKEETADYFEKCLNEIYQKKYIEANQPNVDKINENHQKELEIKVKELDKQIKKVEEFSKKIDGLNEELEKVKSLEQKDQEIIESYQLIETERNDLRLEKNKLEDKIRRLKEENESLTKKIEENKMIVITTEEEIVEEKAIEEVKEEVKIETTFEENAFIDSFINRVKQNGLCYDKKDLCNFHISCKSSPLIILAGASGMGKTRLPLIYAECIGATEENKKLLFLPISPSYTEPSDVLGFYHSRENRYIPSETGFVDLLKHAQDNPNEMHMVIFDEMNLSQIEYWFAPFMSILEKPVNERRINLYSSTLKEKTENSVDYPPSIDLVNNIVFVGTVNLDETTKDMSDRLIDRSIVINLKKQTFNEYSKQEKVEETSLIACSSTANFNSMRPNIDLDYINTLTKDEIDFFDLLHKTLQEYNSGKCISFRNIKKIAMYLKGAESVKDITRKEALDFIFKQTVLKKINGYDESLKQILGSLDGEKIERSALEDVLKKYKSISDFEKTRDEIKRKIKEYNNYGYTR